MACASFFSFAAKPATETPVIPGAPRAVVSPESPELTLGVASRKAKPAIAAAAMSPSSNWNQNSRTPPPHQAPVLQQLVGPDQRRRILLEDGELVPAADLLVYTVAGTYRSVLELSGAHE